jgi:hypothetical protein
MSIVDLSQSSKQIALDSIYDIIKYHIPEHEVKFGRPQPLDLDKQNDLDENTYIPAVVTDQFDYRFNNNKSGFLYRRVRLSELQNKNITIRPPEYPFKITDLLDQINEAAGTQLTEADLVGEVIQTEITNLTLNAHPYSIAWIGSLDVLVQEIAMTIFRTMENGRTRILENGQKRNLEHAMSTAATP